MWIFLPASVLLGETLKKISFMHNVIRIKILQWRIRTSIQIYKEDKRAKNNNPEEDCWIP